MIVERIHKVLKMNCQTQSGSAVILSLKSGLWGDCIGLSAYLECGTLNRPGAARKARRLELEMTRRLP
jgi:hypothetical protein